jgi:hypothetical protein
MQRFHGQPQEAIKVHGSDLGTVQSLSGSGFIGSDIHNVALAIRAENAPKRGTIFCCAHEERGGSYASMSCGFPQDKSLLGRRFGDE